LGDNIDKRIPSLSDNIPFNWEDNSDDPSEYNHPDNLYDYYSTLLPCVHGLDATHPDILQSPNISSTEVSQLFHSLNPRTSALPVPFVLHGLIITITIVIFVTIVAAGSHILIIPLERYDDLPGTVRNTPSVGGCSRNTSCQRAAGIG
jgi:hypothetical protein